MKDAEEKFARFRRTMYGEGFTVTGVYDNFMCTLEAVPGRPDMPRLTMRYRADGVFVRKGDGPFEFSYAVKPEEFVEFVVAKGLSDRPF